jgi:SAM-dependent methyltransferase
MKEKSFRQYSKYYYDFYSKKKNYKKESEVVKRLIKLFQKKPSRTLLDAGCGTGEHLKYLSKDFRCVGMDINKDAIEIAKKNVDADFKVADMIRFDLNKKFDVLICLFSSIGYVQTFDNLVKTLKNFYNQMEDGGLLIVEPWMFKKDFNRLYLGFDKLLDENAKFVRMTMSKIVKSRWLLIMHYLVKEDGKIKHLKEVHRMLALNSQDYVKALNIAGFREIKFLNKKFWEGNRGFFIVNK